MNELVHDKQLRIASTASAAPMPLPAARVAVQIRQASSSDLPFIDALQKAHGRELGWMPAQQLEGKLRLGHILVAEDVRCGELAGYCIGNDRYFKRDDVGIIYQLAVVPAARRALVGAALVRAMFERSAWGCRLFCCWCAQDIAASFFWEALGFVPLAFRAGSRGKGRMHIFWQRRIRAGDVNTPYWYPSQTGGGALREDRLVLPIPPGMHWRDVMPLVLPVLPAGQEQEQMHELPALRRVKRPQQQVKDTPKSGRTTIAAGGLHFVPPDQAARAVAGPRRQSRQKLKNSPGLVAAARELRDRWLEHMNAASAKLRQGKYEVSRSLPQAQVGMGQSIAADAAGKILQCPVAT